MFSCLCIFEVTCKSVSSVCLAWMADFLFSVLLYAYIVHYVNNSIEFFIPVDFIKFSCYC